MAEDNKTDMLCIGCETVGTDHREGEWRKLIQSFAPTRFEVLVDDATGKPLEYEPANG